MWDEPEPPTSPPPPYPGRVTPWSLPAQGDLGQDNSMSLPPCTVHPTPFHYVTRPECLKGLETWVHTCHMEIELQVRHTTAVPPEVLHAHCEWQTPQGVTSRRHDDARPPAERDGGMVCAEMRAAGVRSQAVTNHARKRPQPMTVAVRFHGTLATPSRRRDSPRRRGPARGPLP